MATSVLGNVVEFLDTIGIYDVVLPFLLTFTILFAILEKTKVLGTEKIGKDDVTKKNLNAMTAFVIAFLVIASSKIVEIISTVSSQIVVLLMLAVFYLLLVGSFYKEGQVGTEGLEEGWQKNTFIGIMFAGIILVFANAIKTGAGETWLEVFWNWVTRFWTSPAVASIILIVILIIFMGYITSEKKDKKKGDDDD